MDFKNISEQAEHYVRSYFDEHPNGTLLYHNLYHTERVAKAAKQMGCSWKTPRGTPGGRGEVGGEINKEKM